MSAPIRLLRFHAGEVAVAVAAAAVRTLGSRRDGDAHVAHALGLEPGPADRRRVLELVHGGAVVRLAVDGPVVFDEARADRMVPAPAALPFADLPPVIGLLRDGDRLVLLLDSRRLAAHAAHAG